MAERVRSCRVCGCTDDRACPGGCSWLDIPHDDLCSACEAAAEHVISMTTAVLRWSGEGGKGALGKAVATCSCGNFHYSVRMTPPGRGKQDAAIRRHWQSAVARAKEAAHG